MSTVQLPTSANDAVEKVGALAALLDKNGWKAAAFIAVSVKPGEGVTGRPSKNGERKSFTSERLSAIAFTEQLNAKGWSVNVILRHFKAWQNAAAEGLVTPAEKLVYGERIDIPTEGWANWYPPRWEGNEQDEIVAAQAKKEGVGPTTAVTVARNPKAMQVAIKASPKVAEAAVRALVDRGDVEALSTATAQAAQNRQVQRNRARREEGLSKGRTVQDPKPMLGNDAGLAASLSVKGLADALRALVTTFPQEWEALSDAARADQDFVGFCVETLDKIEIAVANLRSMISNGASVDAALVKFLEAGEAS